MTKAGAHTARRDKSWPSLVAIGLAWLAAIVALDRLGVSEVVATHVSDPVLFPLRAKLDRGPRLAERLKIISLDDTSVDRLGAVDLTPETWRQVLAAIAAARPAAIYVDKLFSITPKDATALPPMSSDVAIISGARITAKPVGSLKALDLAKARYQLPSQAATWPPLAEAPGGRAFGPSGAFASLFTGVGHIMGADSGRVKALIHLGGRTVVPHLGLSGPTPLTYVDGGLVLGGARIPLDRRGQLLVNFVDPSLLQQRNRRILPVIDAVASGAPVPNIEPGDAVLILPTMFTGSGDFAPTPFGQLPGGFIVASVLNSQLTGDWLAPLPGALAVTAALIALGLFVARRTRPRAFLPSLAGAVVGWLVLATVLFIAFGLYVEPILPGLAMGGAALTALARRFHFAELLRDYLRQVEREAERMQTELNDTATVAAQLLPRVAPRWDGLEVQTFHEALTETSGDWYAFETAPSGALRHFILCDVTGHGAQAAIVVSVLRTILTLIVRDQAASLESTQFGAQFMATANDVLFRQGGGVHTTTMVIVSIELAQQRIHLLNSGNPAPLLVRRGNETGPPQVQHLQGPRLSLVGAAADLGVAEPASHPFLPGEELVIHSDGLALRKLRRYLLTFGSPNIPTDPAQLWRVVRGAAPVDPSASDDACLVWMRAS